MTFVAAPHHDTQSQTADLLSAHTRMEKKIDNLSRDLRNMKQGSKMALEYTAHKKTIKATSIIKRVRSQSLLPTNSRAGITVAMRTLPGFADNRVLTRKIS